ncbi:undecaprenyldiphospho-muramoylpentapeptide beta-N-acetylglucosaminyltransferase [Aerococcaceae bacterium DSM 111020]|nr:undecaprenyldiphospho-muramoylpentapeptide beta-N-acetylglucosaminyltransferase [Aerococcaceae bacterium DSM 111020]
MTSIQRVILSGGGTGGHIYPALSIYDAIKEAYPDVEVMYIGTKEGLEADIVPKAGVPFEAIEIQGLRRSLSIENIKSMYLMARSSLKAGRLVREFKPDIVIGTGGYVCAPVLFSASIQRIPTFIHEQNSVAGLTNKFLARYVDKIGTCFEEVTADFGRNASKCVYTGNPRAQEILEIEPDPMILRTQFDLDPEKPTVLIFGGSRGAPAINQAAKDALADFAKSNFQVILATGSTHYDEIIKEIDPALRASDGVRVVSYIDNMPQVFQAIDLVICRSGATTLTELTALGLPSILVPSPYVTNNHQEANARALVDNEAAVMIRESELNGQLMLRMVNELMGNPMQLQLMAEQAKKLGTPQAKDANMAEIQSLVDMAS